VNHFVTGAITYTAGALWPYRFVTSVWNDLLSKFGENLALETGTPVTDIVPSKEEQFAYQVVTSRGNILTNHIVHATNAFAGQFIPGLRDKMTSVLAHMSAQRPGQQFPDYNGTRSWSVVYDKGYDYVTQRPSVNGSPGDVMLGGGLTFGKGQGMDSVGRWDDSLKSMDPLVVSHISSIFPTVFQPQWGKDHEEGRIKQVWTGMVAMSGDFLPFVGRLHPSLTQRSPEQGPRRAPEGTPRKGGEVHPGEWLSAGYNGDGMVWAWLSATALGSMIMGSEKDKVPESPGRPGGRVVDWFPVELQPTLQRVKRVDLTDAFLHFA
jgi:glycine/D-amino acid oxidase-like deaminating enzyme